MIYLALASFVGVWICCAVLSFKRSFSKVIGIGGGFIAGAMAFILVAAIGTWTQQPTAPESIDQVGKVATKPNVSSKVSRPVTYGPGLGMTYDEVTRDFAMYIPEMSDAPLASGEQRKMGKSDQSKAFGVLEVVGDLPANVDRTTLSLMLVSDSPGHAVGNLGLLMLFARNVFPDWPDAAEKLVDGIEKLSNRELKPGEPNRAQLQHGDKRIILRLVKQLGMLTITVKHHSAPID